MTSSSFGSVSISSVSSVDSSVGSGSVIRGVSRFSSFSLVVSVLTDSISFAGSVASGPFEEQEAKRSNGNNRDNFFFIFSSLHRYMLIQAESFSF